MMHLPPETPIDRYIIEQALGEGATAVVYRVRHRDLGSVHAMKVLKEGVDSRVVRRLMDEGRTQALLRHDNIVSVTDIVQAEQIVGLVMELVTGPSLAHLLRARRLSLDEVDDLARQIMVGVGAAHQLGMVHRDLKPGNILLARRGNQLRVKITDFGMAKLITGPSLTRTGTTMGTPIYMAPEQIEDSKSVDQRADIWSLGALLYEMVCGKRAFAGNTHVQVFNKVLQGQYDPPEKLVPDLPRRMVDAIKGALVVCANERIVDCGTLWEVWSSDATVTDTFSWHSLP
ncbi:MAG: serine/threonine protein kinase, partial [Proteobacteria bacterium]|nr:serine/threonine protein kinase [Pseudomonadota bacterium]